MRPARHLVWILGLLLGALAASDPGPACAGDGRVPVPTVAKGKGDACVRDTAFMRRNHMTLLEHRRDQTVHAGVRTGREGLRECLGCHAVAGKDGRPVGIDDRRHFCRVCHDYAAVRVDCFECHASRPAAERAALTSAAGKDRR